jgi:Flp pilus assembly pilin Flp
MRVRIGVAALLRRLCRDDSGQDLTEYGLLAALVAVVAISAVTQVGETLRDVFWNVIAVAIP